MNKKPKSDLFLTQLQERASEQARIDEDSPVPVWIKPVASWIGSNNFLFLLFSSFIASITISAITFRGVYSLFERGVLSWLVR